MIAGHEQESDCGVNRSESDWDEDVVEEKPELMKNENAEMERTITQGDPKREELEGEKAAEKEEQNEEEEEDGDENLREMENERIQNSPFNQILDEQE